MILVRTSLRVDPDAARIERTPKLDFATPKNLLHPYRGDSVVTCPTEFGSPVARERMYVWFDRLASLPISIRDISRRSVTVWGQSCVLFVLAVFFPAASEALPGNGA